MPIPPHKDIQTRHGPIAVRAGEDNGPPILMIHGNSTGGIVFKAQFESALCERYRLIALDLPGHGDSPDPTDPSSQATMPAYAEAAADVLQALGADSAVVIGWSLGGHIALQMTEVRDDLRGLIISGTPPCGPGSDDVGGAFSDRPELSLAGKAEHTEADAETFARLAYGEGVRVPEEFVALVRRCDGRVRQSMFEDFVSAESRLKRQIDVVGSWPQPLGIFQGADDAFMPISYFDTLTYKNLWRGAVHPFEGAGHAPFWERAAEFNMLTSEFMLDLDRP